MVTDATPPSDEQPTNSTPPHRSQATPEAPMAAPPSSKGRWAVAVILVMGLAAGTLATWYWRTHERNAEPSGPDAGSVEWNREAAEAELAELSQLYPDARESGNLEPMIRAFRRLVEKHPRFAKARAQLAMALYEARRWEEAFEQIKLSLELEPRQPDVQLLAGTVAMNLNKPDEAALHYARAVEMDPNNAIYRVHLAQTYLMRHDYDKAARTALEALQLDSRAHEAYGLLADVYAQQNKIDLALTTIQKAIDNTPIGMRTRQVIYIRRKAAYLRRQNHPDEALQVLLGLLPQERAEAEVIEDMALCWSLLDKPAEGAALYERELKARPTEPALLYGAARWRIKAKDAEAARRHIEALRRINPRQPAIAQLEHELEKIEKPQGP